MTKYNLSKHLCCVWTTRENWASTLPMEMTSLHASLAQQRVCSALPLTNAGHSRRHRLTMWYTEPASWRKASIIHALCCTRHPTDWVYKLSKLVSKNQMCVCVCVCVCVSSFLMDGHSFECICRKLYPAGNHGKGLASAARARWFALLVPSVRRCKSMADRAHLTSGAQNYSSIGKFGTSGLCNGSSAVGARRDRAT